MNRTKSCPKILLAFLLVQGMVIVSAQSLSAYEPDPTTEKEFVFPGVEIFWSDDHFSAALYPFFSWEHWKSEGRAEIDFLWPLVTWRSSTEPDSGARRWRFRIFPVYRKSQRPRVNLPPKQQTIFFPLYYHVSRGEDKAFTVLFPFIWWGGNTRVILPFAWSGDGQVRALWPFYGSFENWLGKDRIVFVLWPLWMRSMDGDNVNTTLLWPFFRWHGGDEFRGIRLWPLLSWERRSPDRLDSFFLWPFGYHQRKWNADFKKQDRFTIFFPFYWNFDARRMTAFYLLPLYGRVDSPVRSTRWYGWPFYAKTEHHKRDYTEHAVLWPFGFVRSGSRESLELWPLIGYDNRPNLKKQYVLWPIAVRNTRQLENQYERTVEAIMPLIARTRTEFADGTRRSKVTVFPLFLSRKGDGQKSEQRALWPFYTLDARPILRNWYPLFRIYENERWPDGRLRRNALGRVLQWRQSDSRKIFRVNLLLLGYQQEKDLNADRTARTFKILGLPVLSFNRR